MTRVITFGTFDLLHIGHINILQRARNLGDYLMVGVSSDALNYSKKKFYPVYSQQDRISIISSLRFVDFTFLEESLEKKEEYICKYKADILVMGDDWTDKFNYLSHICKIIYLPRTENISTSEVKSIIIARNI